MSSLTSPTRHPAASADELDDILNGLAEGRDVGVARTAQQAPVSHSKRATADAGGDLGIDEEVVVTKKRIPIPKLDEFLLISDPRGLSRLRVIGKERLRFKGKGHEYGDVTRMLNMYQLWLDDLYPRAKFADALAMVEKAGHTKRMQVMRKEWIEMAKPRRASKRDVDNDDDADAEDSLPAVAHPTDSARDMDGVEPSLASNEILGIEEEQRQQTQSPSRAMPAEQEDPDEDELDALLAQSAPPTAGIPPNSPSRTKEAHDDPFADDMEAMADMDDMW